MSDATSDRSHRPRWDGRLNLEQQKKRAKELLRALRAGDDSARARLHASHPRGAQFALANVQLADAQLVIALDDQHASWPRRVVSITPHGEAVRTGRADALADRAERFVGGVRVHGGSACWRWDEASQLPVYSIAKRSA